MTVRTAEDITENVISFYSPITSSTYGILTVVISICLIDSTILSDMFL